MATTGKRPPEKKPSEKATSEKTPAGKNAAKPSAAKAGAAKPSVEKPRVEKPRVDKPVSAARGKVAASPAASPEKPLKKSVTKAESKAETKPAAKAAPETKPAKVAAKPAPAKAAESKPAPAKPAAKSVANREPVAKPAASAAKEAKPAAKPASKSSAKAAPASPEGTLTEEQLLAMPESDYMNEAQLEFFRQRLLGLRADILENARETGEHLKENEVFADPNDRATVEEENMLEQRVRDRERKLLKKIESTLNRIDSGDYGYCKETGDPIGLPRLLARPTADLSIEAQEKHERLEKLYAD